MKIPATGLYADTHPTEIISRVQRKLVFFNNFLSANSEVEKGGVNIDQPEIADGIFWLIDGLACELDYALNKIVEV